MTDLEEIVRIAVDSGYRLHRDLGPGILESVYESVLAGMLSRNALRVERQKTISFTYAGMSFTEGLKADLLVEGRLII